MDRKTDLTSGVCVEVEVVWGVEGFVEESVTREIEGDDAVGLGERDKTSHLSYRGSVIEEVLGTHSHSVR